MKIKKNPLNGLKMFLGPQRVQPQIRIIIFVIIMTMMMQNVNGKPQDADVFEKVASQAIAVAGNVAEMVGNAGMISKNMGFNGPFANGNSDTKIGTGAALRNNDDDSSEEDRRKRSLDSQFLENSKIAEGSLFTLPLNRELHFHRGKRSPCHTYGTGGGGTGGGTGGSGIPEDGDDLDIQRRLRAYARKRKAAAKKAKNSRKKKLIDNEDDEKQVLTRRKRQSEVDDLNETMQNASNGFAQQAQQIAEKIRTSFESFMTSISNMAENIKQHFTGQNSTNNMEI